MGIESVEEFSVLESTFEKTAEESARPMAPPRERRKLRTEITTARSCFLEWAWGRYESRLEDIPDAGASNDEDKHDLLCFESAAGEED